MYYFLYHRLCLQWIAILSSKRNEVFWKAENGHGFFKHHIHSKSVNNSVRNLLKLLQGTRTQFIAQLRGIRVQHLWCFGASVFPPLELVADWKLVTVIALYPLLYFFISFYFYTNFSFCLPQCIFITIILLYNIT